MKKLSFITCLYSIVRRLKVALYKRVRFDSLIFNTPKFLFISYRFFYAFFIKLPSKKDFIYTFPLDIQRITGYS
jgi:hypothetical protein